MWRILKSTLGPLRRSPSRDTQTCSEHVIHPFPPSSAKMYKLSFNLAGSSTPSTKPRYPFTLISNMHSCPLSHSPGSPPSLLAILHTAVITETKIAPTGRITPLAVVIPEPAPRTVPAVPCRPRRSFGISAFTREGGRARTAMMEMRRQCFSSYRV